MTIFKKIIDKEIPSDFVYEDDNIIVIKDIIPKAKTHLLIIPKKVIESINHIEESDSELLASMFFIAKKLAKQL
jgi:histidine triad (HIT) family protein